MAYGYYGGFPEYVPVAERRKRAARKLAQLRKKGHDPKPVQIDGRAIATTFWGKAWCDHLESHADLANRLPRGRTYVRNGSVIDLQIAEGEVRALVSGSEIYEVKVRIQPLAAARWKAVRRECAGQIGTVVELLAGKFSSAVMEVLCHRQKGLFPGTRELAMSCSCPDGAWLCKHLAAVLYGVGARLDHAPELLFTLRGVDGAELVAAAGRGGSARERGARRRRDRQGAPGGDLRDRDGGRGAGCDGERDGAASSRDEAASAATVACRRTRRQGQADSESEAGPRRRRLVGHVERSLNDGSGGGSPI